MATVTVHIDPSIFRAMDKLVSAASQAVNTTLAAVNQDFQSSVQHFVHKPSFTTEQAQLKGDKVEGRVFTTDENYYRLSKGTTAHLVPKGRKGRMAYFTGYNKKTAPGRIESSPGGSFGPRIVRYGQWTVSGIDARNYDELIKQKNQPVLASAFASALKSVK